MPLLPSLARKSGQGWPFAALNTSVEGKMYFFHQTAPSQQMDEALFYCLSHLARNGGHCREIFYLNREYFLPPWFWPSEWITGVLEGLCRQVLKLCPLWKRSTPSSVTLSEAMWAAIHFSLPLPAVHLLFLSAGHLLPPIHLLREAAAHSRPPSWTDGKQSDWSCVQLPLPATPPDHKFNQAVSNFSLQPAVRKCKTAGGNRYEINRLGWGLTVPVSWSLCDPQCHRNMKLQQDNNSPQAHSFSSKSNAAAIPVINQQLMGKLFRWGSWCLCWPSRDNIGGRAVWHHISIYIFTPAAPFPFCFTDCLLWCSSTISTASEQLIPTYNQAVVLYFQNKHKNVIISSFSFGCSVIRLIIKIPAAFWLSAVANIVLHPSTQSTEKEVRCKTHPIWQNETTQSD